LLATIKVARIDLQLLGRPKISVTRFSGMPPPKIKSRGGIPVGIRLNSIIASPVVPIFKAMLEIT
jgi:hypothetical protein